VAPLFPVWADTALRVGLACLALAVPAVFVVPMIYVRTPYNLERGFPVDQPVQFDHRHHVQDDEIPCLYCHSLAERSASAGVPATELCMGCHGQIWNQSPMLEPVRRSYFSGQPIPWRRVNNVPDFVYFNHAVHVNGGVDCTACHGDVAAMPLVYQARLLTMGFCLGCHRAQPPDRQRRPDVVAAAAPSEDQHRRTIGAVPALTSCSTCHR
jgi:hypothetical protein